MVNVYWFVNTETLMQPTKQAGCAQSISRISWHFLSILGLQMVWLLAKSDVIQ
jgi:hypothetical protein